MDGDGGFFGSVFGNRVWMVDFEMRQISKWWLWMDGDDCFFGFSISILDVAALWSECRK